MVLCAVCLINLILFFVLIKMRRHLINCAGGNITTQVKLKWVRLGNLIFVKTDLWYFLPCLAMFLLAVFTYVTLHFYMIHDAIENEGSPID